MADVARDQLALAGLALGVLVMLTVTVVTSRRPAPPAPSLAGYFDRWSAVHGGYDPAHGSVWVRGWLSAVYRLARPLARTGVQPDVLTMWTLLVGLAVLAAAAEGGRWLMLAGWLVVLGGIGDSLDGAVAVLTERTSTWGYVLDSFVDRINDVIYVAAVVIAGAPPALGVACGAGIFLLEYLRARGGNAGAGEIGAVTVGERPNRVAFCAVGLHFSGVFGSDAAFVSTAALGVLTAVTFTGLGQLAVAVRRQLRG